MADKAILEERIRGGITSGDGVVHSADVENSRTTCGARGALRRRAWTTKKRSRGCVKRLGAQVALAREFAIEYSERL